MSSFCARVEDAVKTGRYGLRVKDEYKAYAKGLNGTGRLTFKRESAERFKGLEPLIDRQFLIVSEKYRRWFQAHAKNDVHTVSA